MSLKGSTTARIIDAAKRRAKRMVDNKEMSDDMIIIALRRRVASEIGIGIFDPYFEQLTLRQLAFEAYYYIHEQAKIHGTTAEEDLEKLKESIENIRNNPQQNESFVAPPGFEDLFNNNQDGGDNA